MKPPTLMPEEPLFARPSLLEGAGRIFDFGNTMTQYNEAPTPGAVDAIAMALDWHAVGDDIRDALAQFEVELAAQQRLFDVNE
ncbi:MAG: hypothetical protein LC789_18570 [Actinobacteria bacterium]|nr:hypothetical protein [Actinomycetota bacterium]